MLKNNGQLKEFRVKSLGFRVQGLGYRVKHVKRLVLNIGIFIFFVLSPIPYPLFPVSYAGEDFVYDVKGKRDPFIPLVSAEGRLLKLDTEKVKGALTLEGIIYDEASLSYAIVSGTVVKVGDIINENQVLKVEKDKVVFIKDGQTFELELKEKEEK